MFDQESSLAVVLETGFVQMGEQGFVLSTQNTVDTVVRVTCQNRVTTGRKMVTTGCNMVFLLHYNVIIIIL